MIDILEQIFRNSEFTCLKEFAKDVGDEKKTLLRRIYVNSYDEMYFILEGEIHKEILADILGICAEAEADKEIQKRYKSNWVLILLSPVSGELSWEDRKRVLLIEENKYFCRKYVMWYNSTEKKELEELCQGDYSIQNINKIIENYTHFSRFKASENEGYDCLSRIFIKLPYLSLNSLETTDKTIADFVQKKLNEIHPELFYKLKTGDIDAIEEYITLSDKEKNEIDKKIELLGKEKK